MSRTAAAAGRPIAKVPLLQLEAHIARIEGGVKELDHIEDRGVRGKEAKVRYGWRRDFKPELERTGLAEQATHLEVIGRAGLRPECQLPEESSTAHLGQIGQCVTSVGGDHGRERKVVVDARRDRLSLCRREGVPDGSAHRARKCRTGRCRLAFLYACRCYVHAVGERQRGNRGRVVEIIIRRRQDFLDAQ